MVNRFVTAIFTIAATVGVVGLIQTASVQANQGQGPGENGPATPSDSEKNHPEYWEKVYPGSTCKKYDNVNALTFTVPASPAGTVYVAAIIKSGSDQSNEEDDETHQVDTSVKAGDVLTHDSGREISHVILCYKKAASTPGTPTQTNGDEDTPTVPASPTSGGGAVSGDVASLPVTSGASDQVAAVVVIIASILATAGGYALRARTGLSI